MKSTKKFIVGLDIGASNMRAVLMTSAGVIFRRAKDATPVKSRKEFLNTLKAMIEQLIFEVDRKKILGIGCGVVGISDMEKGTVLMADNLRILNGFNIKKWLSEKFDCEARVDNDSRSFTRGEYFFGAGKKFKNIIGMTLGTGIGGGIVIGGKVFHGSFNSAGEIGHMVYHETELEDLISAESLKKIGLSDSFTAYKLAKSGDKKAKKIFGQLGKYLGIGLSNLVNILDPEAIIIGGGIAGTAELFMEDAKRVMKKHIISPKSRKNVKILKGKLGEDAGPIGAAALFNDNQS